jgi:cellulose biosynthesis protein BcsQ
MAVNQQFEALFASPTLKAMHALGPGVFEHFVEHVFTAAGYNVKHVANKKFPHGPGVDLELYSGPIKGKPLVYVEVRRYAEDNLLGYHDVTDFVGVLQVAGGIPGYLVTTSSFNENAKIAEAQVGKSVRLIDGNHLLRYIAYIGGSRLSGQYAGLDTAPAKPTSPAWLFKADDVESKTTRPPRQTRILTVANVKGGVAKTTTALNVGFALADLKQQRVLLIDMDGQASLTHSLPRPVPEGAPKNTPAPPDEDFITDYFRGKSSLASRIRTTRFPKLSVIPAQEELYRLQFAGADRARAELQFVEDVRSLAPDTSQNGSGAEFDWIILDTPATDSYYGRAALAAADYVIIPAFAEQYATQGIKAVLTTVKTMSALMVDTDRWKERILGCLVTRWKPGPNADAVIGNVGLYLNQNELTLFKKRIPADERVETAHRGTVAGGVRSIFRLTPQMGAAAKAYDEFVKEMQDDVNSREA